MMKMVISRFKVPAVIFVAFIGFAWVMCSRLFNTHDSDVFYSEQKYNEGLGRIYYDLGMLRYKRGDYKNATRAFKNAIQADQSLIVAYEALQSTYMLRSKSNKAAAIKKQAASIRSTVHQN
ncbi:tetratricopeptide repeat protein [Candidatus Dependentiae bacterium]|nr:tetratricopeptide repeat protein [Candidatus Dependentiae bacterium]